MGQMILYVVAMAALVQLVHVAPWRMAKERMYGMVAYKRIPCVRTWPRTYRYAARNTTPRQGIEQWIIARPKQDGSAMMRHVNLTGATMLVLSAALYLLPGLAAAHGSAEMEQDPCMRLAGERQVHFSAYQPQHALNEQYCTDIPQEGDTFLVIDLMDPTLRTEPVGMQVMRGNDRNEGEGQIVADVRPSTHPDGVLRSEIRLDEGLYSVIIASETQNLMKRPQYRLRVHMIDYQKLMLSTAGPLIGVLLSVWLLYKFIRSRWFQRFLAASSS